MQVKNFCQTCGKPFCKNHLQLTCLGCFAGSAINQSPPNGQCARHRIDPRADQLRKKVKKRCVTCYAEAATSELVRRLTVVSMCQII